MWDPNLIGLILLEEEETPGMPTQRKRICGEDTDVSSSVTIPLGSPLYLLQNSLWSPGDFIGCKEVVPSIPERRPKKKLRGEAKGRRFDENGLYYHLYAPLITCP